MKKPIVVSVLIYTVLLAWGFFTPSHAQGTSKEEKPTFYRLVPGTYVNGWPRFTITYPKDWVEKRHMVMEVFAARPPGPADVPGFAVGVAPNFGPLDKWAEFVVRGVRMMSTDVTIVSDKPARLQDGSPAREVELRWIRAGFPSNWFGVGTKKGDLLIATYVGSVSEKTAEDLKAIPYSIEFDPGKDEPVKVPPDVREFIDKHCSANVSHDFAKVWSNFSDRYLNSGERKREVERYLRPIIDRITSFEIVITDFIPAGDIAYLTGFTIGWWGKAPLNNISIIKENGEWKWYGNQRDVSP
jgi:hypothetical protein